MLEKLGLILAGFAISSLFWVWLSKKAALRNGVAEIHPERGWQWKDFRATEQELDYQTKYSKTIWDYCHIVYWPLDGSYPIEHNPHVNKVAQRQIDDAMQKDGLL